MDARVRGPKKPYLTRDGYPMPRPAPPVRRPSFPIQNLGLGWTVRGKYLVGRNELAAAIEKWGVLRWGRGRVQLQVWIPDKNLAVRVTTQYRRKFYECRVTRPYLAPHTTVYPVTFSQRGTAAVLLWTAGRMCPKHQEIARRIWLHSEIGKRIRSKSAMIRKGTDRYQFLTRTRRERQRLFREVRSASTRFWTECPVSAYGEYVRTRDAQAATED